MVADGGITIRRARGMRRLMVKKNEGGNGRKEASSAEGEVRGEKRDIPIMHLFCNLRI
jgi:hypothetical protein